MLASPHDILVAVPGHMVPDSLKLVHLFSGWLPPALLGMFAHVAQMEQQVGCLQCRELS